MNGDQFYEEFKNALKCLGLSWGDMALVQVCVVDQRLAFSFGEKTLSVHIGGYSK